MTSGAEKSEAILDHTMKREHPPRAPRVVAGHRTSSADRPWGWGRGVRQRRVLDMKVPMPGISRPKISWGAQKKSGKPYKEQPRKDVKPEISGVDVAIRVRRIRKSPERTVPSKETEPVEFVLSQPGGRAGLPDANKESQGSG